MTLSWEQGPLDLPDLRLVVAIGEAGSLAGAAKRLRVNHASAWRRLGALEARLGVRLFDRDRTGYAATVAGETAVATGRRVLEELRELERRLAGQDIRPTGVVRLTTTDTLAGLVAPVVAGLRVSHPGIVIELSTTNTYLALTRREADIALRSAAEAPEGLIARRLGTVATAVYGAPSYLEGRSRDPLALDWLMPDDSLSHLGSARWIERHLAPERIVHRAGSLLTLAALARAGAGVAALPCLLVDATGDLTPLTAPVSEMAVDLWLLTHPDLRRTARVRAVLDALARHLPEKLKRCSANANRLRADRPSQGEGPSRSDPA